MPSLISSRHTAGQASAVAIRWASVVFPDPAGPLTTTSVGNLSNASVGRRERAPRMARAEEPVRAARSVTPGDVVLGGADLPRLQHGVHDAPRPLDLVEPQKRRVVAFQHVEQ